MSDHSSIEWTDATWNPVTGCSKVSPGCAHCYIERTPPFRMEGRRFTTWTRFADNVSETTTGVRMHPDRLDQPIRWRKPRRVFVCSLADLFHDDVPSEYIARVFNVMASATLDCGKAHIHTDECWGGVPHAFQVLTKRPERALRVIRDELPEIASTLMRGDSPLSLAMEVGAWPLPNVWVGVSIENARYTWRADVLRQIPAAVRFISAEPLLGSLVEDVTGSGRPEYANAGRAALDLSGIDWVIAGGESGPGARPMHPDWARELRDACEATRQLCPPCDERGFARPFCPECKGSGGVGGVRFFFKQWGEHDERLRRVGRKAAGRVLDGRTWDEMPGGAA